MYYGQTSCEQDTERYLDVVKYVFSSYKKEVPLVINTMGWVKGKQDKSVLKGWCRREVIIIAVHHHALKKVQNPKVRLTHLELVLVFHNSVLTCLCSGSNRVFSALKGEGLLLLIDIIRLLSPSHIVQMDVYDWKAMAPLTPEYVHLTPGLYTKGKQQAKCKQMGMSGVGGWKSCEGEGDASAPEYKLLYIHPEFPRAGVAGEA